MSAATISATWAPDESTTSVPDTGHFYLVGGGIASLAAAAFLCRDGRIDGRRITVIEALDLVGGSLDAEGSAQHGYVMRGARVFDAHDVCTHDVFSSIPTLEGDRAVAREMFQWNDAFTQTAPTHLIRDAQGTPSQEFELTEVQIQALEGLIARGEQDLDASSIAEHFDPAFFRSDFWLRWCTAFALQPWHSAIEFRRYLLRFGYQLSGSEMPEGVIRTPYNQYDSMVRPLHKWLREHGVQFAIHTRVTDLAFEDDPAGTRVSAIHYLRGTKAGHYVVKDADHVLITLGSMTEGSTQGAMDRPAQYCAEASAGAWALWARMAHGRPALGRPAAFADHIDESRWLSFTTTLHERAFFNAVREFTGTLPAEGGCVTFARSSWLISLVLPHQPHFMGQPENVCVLWGYGLCPDAPGDFVRKPMYACTGREIMTEVLGHLGMPSDGRQILRDAICIPCQMPYLTAQFLRRRRGDRPAVIPHGYRHLALIGQFCEVPDDVVFSVEYSVRSAQRAVYGLLGLEREPPPVYRHARARDAGAHVLE